MISLLEALYNCMLMQTAMNFRVKIANVLVESPGIHRHRFQPMAD